MHPSPNKSYLSRPLDWLVIADHSDAFRFGAEIQKGANDSPGTGLHFSNLVYTLRLKGKGSGRLDVIRSLASLAYLEELATRNLKRKKFE